MDYKNIIRTIPDWPSAGVSFKDITPVLADAAAFKQAIDEMCEPFLDAGITKVFGAEARGFFFGTTMAYKLGAGFIPARKAGKLPYVTVGEEYTLEYGKAVIEVHKDDVTDDDRILIVDDVLATGGTAAAKAHLINKLGATLVGYSFFIELDFLNGREQLEKSNAPIHSLVRYQ
ncbi:MAG: adenine phosphoribosyltransferase [Coriobacteriia bacterium]|nr:adenine phosphoribosyltransferase [Coriobacteriia bacterium]MCL2746441.1 adenine phosphoribosyltransferase [Coriobacteriia bacterium]MCL2870687.1 adenine phosphoribosyltransferase [Coriobacteriia bacterium]